MKYSGMLAGTALAVGLALAPASPAAEGTGPTDALTSGKAGISLRARFETVDQDGYSDDANALTARLRLNYATGEWNGWRGFVEFDHVFHLVDDFNSGAGTSPNKTAFPVVADPKGPDLNQLFLDFHPDEDWTFRVGRQRILLDDQRFVGGVGWRQNEQTYDGIGLTTTAIPRTTLRYSYVDRVRRIFGSTVAAGVHDTETHLLNAQIALGEDWSITPYYYYIDNRDEAAFSTNTLGARIEGALPVAGNDKLAVIIEYATQADATNNPVDFEAQYLHADAMLSFDRGVSFGLAYESLGGDATEPGMMFRTPLATLHKFQGWADQFLTTPSQGINDLYATVALGVASWTFTAVYHDFTAEAGGADYGRELDASVARKLGQHLSLLIKGAFFSGDTPAYADTSKVWIMLTSSF